MLEAKSVVTEISDEHLRRAVERVLNPRYGARPVNNLFAKFIKKLVSEIVLEDELRRVKTPGAKGGGNVVIEFDRPSDEFTATFKPANGASRDAITKKMKLESLDLNTADR